MRIAVLSVAMMAGLAACASTAPYSAVADREAGSVLVSYETGEGKAPALSPGHANRVATRRCEVLGYSYTERDVHVAQQCSATDGAGACSRWQVRQTYRCAGNAVSDPQDTPVAVTYVPPPHGAARP